MHKDVATYTQAHGRAPHLGHRRACCCLELNPTWSYYSIRLLSHEAAEKKCPSGKGAKAP
jgi:hypothetical protein